MTMIKLAEKYACPFPVGAVYISVTDSSPSTTWPGTTWDQIAQGRCLVGQSSSYGAGSTGDPTHKHGTSGHTLTTAEIPAHAHGLNGHTHGMAHIHKTAIGKHNHNLNSAGKGVYVNKSGDSSRNRFTAVSSGSAWTDKTSSSDNYEWRTQVVEADIGTKASGGARNTGDNADRNSTDGCSTSTADNTGGGGSHSHGDTDSKSVMPPWFGVYMWKRTA